MNSDPNSTRPHAQVPPPALRGYTGPLATYHQPHSDYLHHPLHRVYRRKIRGVRMLWFGAGMVVGGILGFALIIILTALVYTRIPALVQTVTDEPDVTITISEQYLSSEAGKRLGEGFQSVNPNLTLIAVSIEITSENRIDYQANFHVNIPFVSTDISAAIKNQINVQDGELVINMVGDPQLGNLNLSLDLLPFNLKGEITRAIDRVNNDLVVSEMNKFLESSLTGTNFFLEGVTTDERDVMLLLRQK
ncbi:MAG TPA: hypothetical protein VJ183_07340 [Chloroflexia bacterium]|nr:hypothetical protein [Chloroflexia bacterium]